MHKNYELLEHTADLGIRVWGAGIEELFINSASAMYDLIADISSIKPVISKRVEVAAQDKDELLKKWLSELLYYFHVKDILFSRFFIEKIGEEIIVSTAKGEEIDKKRHNLKHDIKAVTFHNLRIEEKDSRFSTDIIFDI